jgi:hypothetical protein
MYKKINVYIIVGLWSFCNVAFGMEQQKCLQKLLKGKIAISFGSNKNIYSAVAQQKSLQELQEGTIPVLGLNDYVVNVSSAYQALKKEACLGQDMFRYIIKRANKEMRTLYAQQGIVYRIPDVKTYERITEHTQHPYFRAVEIVYRDMPSYDNKLNAHIRIDTLVYYVVPVFFRSVKYCNVQQTTESSSASLRNNIDRLVPKGKPLFIEFYCPDQISDWITVENKLSRINSVASAKLSQRDSTLFHEQDLDYKFINQAGIGICSCSFIFVTTVLSAVVLGLSFL